MIINNTQDTGTLPVDQSQASNPTEEGGLSQEQMRTNLQALAGDIDSKYQDFNSQKFATKNKLELQKREALKEAFNIMTEAGINLEDPEDVKLFLDSLKEKNPELYQIVESSLEALFNDGTDTTTGEGNFQEPSSQVLPTDLKQNNMNMNTNVNSSQNLS